MNTGAHVAFRDYPTIQGTIAGFIPETDECPESVSVDMWIPEDDPGFEYTGKWENFWCGREALVVI